MPGWKHTVESWGSTAAERELDYPCDGVILDPDRVLFRAVDVDAPPTTLFRWLCQLRVAPYSYDLLDNLGRRSPRELTPGLDELEVGQQFMTIFTLVSFERDRHVTLFSRTRAFGEVAGTYLVVPSGEHARLVVKLLVRYPRGITGALLRRVLPTGDLFMMRKQLRTLATLATLAARDVG